MPRSEVQLAHAATVASSGTSCHPGRVRVLFLVKRIVGGGAERVVTKLVQGLSRPHFEPHLAAVSIDAYRQDIPDDVVIHKLNATEMKWAIPSLISLVCRVRPHVILSTLPEANMAVLLARPFLPPGTRVIVREASNVSDTLKYLLPFPFAWKCAYRLLYPYADAIICQSRSMRADVLRHIPIDAHKVIQIYNGVDIFSIKRSTAVPSPYVGGGPNLLAAGRLSLEKNFSLLLHAFASIRTRSPSARLTILGSGPEESALKRTARELGLDDAVEFAGFQDNPFPYYHYADLYMQTSLFEGLPNVLLEVLALDTPAVATVAGGATEEIAEVAGSVRLVRDVRAEAYADAVIEVLRGPRPVLRRNEFLHVFGIERMLREYESVFANLAAKSPLNRAQAVGTVVHP